MNAKQQAKVAWFLHRTGADAAEAEWFLKQAKFKIDEAIKLRQDHYRELYRTRPKVGDVVTPEDTKL